jgi:hypothetical protein
LADRDGVADDQRAANPLLMSPVSL